MKKLLIILSLIVVVVAPVATFAKSETEIPEVTVEGLVLVPGTKEIAYVWAEPGADLSKYDRVYLTEPSVAFKKNWDRDYNRNTSSLSSRVTNSDMERIKKGLGELFIEVFKEELEAGGYTLASERAEDVLLVKTEIHDLDINAPDIRSSGRSESFATSAGSMTLYMELYDSQTDDLLAKAADPTKDRDSSILQLQTGPANKQAARRMMKPWAEALRKGLDKARESTKQ